MASESSSSAVCCERLVEHVFVCVLVVIFSLSAEAIVLLVQHSVSNEEHSLFMKVLAEDKRR